MNELNHILWQRSDILVLKKIFVRFFAVPIWDYLAIFIQYKSKMYLAICFLNEQQNIYFFYLYALLFKSLLMNLVVCCNSASILNIAAILILNKEKHIVTYASIILVKKKPIFSWKYLKSKPAALVVIFLKFTRKCPLGNLKKCTVFVKNGVCSLLYDEVKAHLSNLIGNTLQCDDTGYEYAHCIF